MFLLESYSTAVIFCVVTMLCWGSWANTQKMVGKSWRYELFYWDYVFGVVLASILFALTMGSCGEFGRGFFDDLRQAEAAPLIFAFLGGVIFNIANILLVAAIAIAGMAVAFPVGIGLALVLGVLLNYFADPTASGNQTILFLGVGLVTGAILLNAAAYKRLQGKETEKAGGKGLFLSIFSGVLMSLFYYLVAMAIGKVVFADGGKSVPLTLTALRDGGMIEAGKLTPYSADVIFAFGVLASNFIVMPILMRKPITGTPVPFRDYFKGGIATHCCGLLGGIIWSIGMTLNVVASGVASSAIAYGLGQGATLMSAIWGVFIWREFKNAPKGTGRLLSAMFLFFIVGLGLIIWTKM